MPFLNPARFRAALRRQGERVRWFKALESSDYNPTYNAYDRNSPVETEFGFVYVEQTLAPDVRVLITGFRTTMQTPDMGLIKVGNCKIACLPDEVLLNRMDRLVLLQRTETTREVIRRGVDRLLRPYAHAIKRIDQMGAGGTTTFSPGDYELSEDGTSIVWTSGGPDIDSDYSVEYAFRPIMWYLNDDNQSARPSKYGELLPQRGTLTMMHPSQLNLASSGE